MLSIARRIFLTLITVGGLYASTLAFQSAPLIDNARGTNVACSRSIRERCVPDSQTAFLRGTFALLLTVTAFGACLLILKDEPRSGADARGTED